MDRKDLKIQALKEAAANLQDKLADLRVDFTIVSFEKEQLEQRVQELEAQVVHTNEGTEVPTDSEN